MDWLIGLKSQLTTENKILLYTTILNPIWAYEAQIWVTAAKSHLEILQRFQNKAIRTILNAPYYGPNS